jgi:HEPN domain-containing protein
MSSQEAREWVVKAETDFKAALALARQRKEPLPEVVCFHCQQCAEKYLKAFLVSLRQPFPKTHDLIALKNLCVEHDSDFEQVHDWLESLEGYDVAIRYPGETATIEDAREALAAVKGMRRFVQDKLITLIE